MRTVFCESIKAVKSTFGLIFRHTTSMATSDPKEDWKQACRMANVPFARKGTEEYKAVLQHYIAIREGRTPASYAGAAGVKSEREKSLEVWKQAVAKITGSSSTVVLTGTPLYDEVKREFKKMMDIINPRTEVAGSTGATGTLTKL